MAISCQRRSTVSKNRRDFIEAATILHLELINVWTSEMKFIVKRQYVPCPAELPVLLSHKEL